MQANVDCRTRRIRHIRALVKAHSGVTLPQNQRRDAVPLQLLSQAQAESESHVLLGHLVT
jgi:hypothetical protein